MKNKTVTEIIIVVVLIGLLLLLGDVFHHFMPSMMLVVVLAATVGVFGLFISFVLRETPGDEREQIHRLVAGRVAFLIGTAVVLVGIVVESFSGTPDKWLLIALGVMVTSKIIARIHSDYQQ